MRGAEGGGGGRRASHYGKETVSATKIAKGQRNVLRESEEPDGQRRN